MAQLSEWLELMLAEIARKQDEEHRAVEELARRRTASEPAADAPSSKHRTRTQAAPR